MAFTNTQTKLGKALVTNAAGEYALRTISGDSAAVYTVDADGAGQYATIQAALDAIDAAVVIAALTDYTTSRYILKIAPGSYTENLTIGNAKYLKIEMAGVKVTGTCTLTTTQQTGDYYSKLEFVGGAGNRPDKGDCGQITSHVTGTRNNDSLMYVGFHGMELGGNLGFTNNGTWVINTSNTMFSSSSAFVYGSFVGAGSPSVLLETGQGTRIKGHITNTDTSVTNVALYDCLDTEFDLINIDSSFGGKIRNCEFSSDVTIADGSYEVDEFSWGQIKAQTDTLTGATFTHPELGVDKDHQGYYSLNDQTTTNQDAHGTAYRLDGTNDKIAAANNAQLDITTGDFSMYREVYVPSLTAAITLWEKWEDAGDYWYLQIETTGAITFKTAIATVTKGHYTTAAGLVTAGTNVKIGFVSDRDGTKGQFYVNLLPVTTTETTAMAATSITNTGALNWGFDGATGYSEYEDQYGSLWNLAHSAAEVKDVKNIPFKWQYGSQTNIITGDNVDFGADAVDKTAFDVAYDQWTVNANPTSIAVATNVLSITAAASNDGIYMTALEIGKEYTLSINVSSITGTWNIESPLNTNVATITATGQQTLNFIANDTLLRIYASAASDQISIDASAISNNLVPLGAVALYDNESISDATWYDKANGNDGTVTGASVLNPLPVATDSDNIPIFSVTSGITADTGSAQGNGVLTSSINQIATCANAGDAVTLPSAKPGKVLWVTNDGANAADVFPASGDNIDEAGANTALSVAVDAEVQFICTSSGHWSTITSA